MSSDVSGDNSQKESSSDKANKRPVVKYTVKGRSRAGSSGADASVKRKLGKKRRETSHGVAMKHFIRSRDRNEATQDKYISDAPKEKSLSDEIQPAEASKKAADTPIEAQEASTKTKASEGEQPIKKNLAEAIQSEAEKGEEAESNQENVASKNDADSNGVSESEQTETKQEDSAARLPMDESVLSADMQKVLAAIWRYVTKQLKPPRLSVHHIRFDQSTILAYTTAEEIPREMVNVRARINLGTNYHDLKVDLHTDVHKRNTTSVKWTKMSPVAPKHLRFVTPGAQHKFDRLFPNDITHESITMQKRHLAFASGEMPPSVFAQDSGSLDNKRDGVKSTTESPPFSALTAGGPQVLNVASGSSLYDVRCSPPKTFPSPSKKAREVVPQNKTRTEGRPKGGSVRIEVNGRNLFRPEITPELAVTVTGRRLHVPILERLLEVPIDIQDGRVDGVVYITANTPRTWQMPRIDGSARVTDADLHFWDSPDHLFKANMDLQLENNRMYFHNASGHYGAVPLKMTGDMDLDPEFGEYRLTAVVAPVEVNVARATFGIRPTPNSIAGALEGIVHCTGPLRQPMFSGVINCVEPTPKMLKKMENTPAKTALTSLSNAVGALDKVPFTFGKVLFTHDTSTDVFSVHEFLAEPAGGGKLRGSGQVWVSPAGEHDPQALHIRCDGHGIAAREIAQRYIPEGLELPVVLDCGATNLRISVKGSHAAPITEVKFEAPSVQVSGEASLSRQAWNATASAPSFELSGTLHTEFPPFEITKRIYVQEEMLRICQPKIKGVDADVNLKGLDVLPLFSSTPTLNRAKSRQAVRLKVSGKTHITAKRAASENAAESNKQERFDGDVTLQALRVNQVNLTKLLNGKLEVSPTKVSLYAKGTRDDELIDFDIHLPEAGNWLPQEGLTQNEPMQENASSTAESQEKQSAVAGGHFNLKQGRLDISSQINSETNRVQMQVRGLTLDELELASLRGDLQNLSLDLNFLKKEGRGELMMTNPRYSGLLGELLTGGFRWERDVIRLEKMMLQQKASRYEVQGEYAVPASPSQPDLKPSPVEPEGTPNWLPGEVLAATAQNYTGRWRIQVNVPNADIQEILPAMRLLRQATSAHEIDYETAKEEFLRAVNEMEFVSPPLRDFVTDERLKKETEGKTEFSEALTGTHAVLPGIQSLKGKWQGTLQAFGGGGGASTLNFNLRGEAWKWGDYEVDEAVAAGTYHSAEGAHLEEISLRTGEARFMLRGDVLGPKQDATFILHEFPAALLSPVYKTIPALQNAAPPMADQTQGIKRLMDGWERTKTTLGLSDIKEDTPMEKLTKDSPVNGLLYVQGSISGSVNEPQGYLRLVLYDGVVGTTQLSTASAHLNLDPEQSLRFKLDLVPQEFKGMLKAEGTLPLSQKNADGDIDIQVQIRDGGMAIVTTMIPDCKWESGSANINLHVSGQLKKPKMEGKARISRATVFAPNLKFPLKNVFGTVRVEDGRVIVENFESKSGKHGHIKAKGALPLLKEHVESKKQENELGVDVSKLELKVNSVYNGRLDSHLKFHRCLKEPVISGEVEVSRGTAILQLGAIPHTAPSQEATTAMAIPNLTMVRFQDTRQPSSEGIALPASPVIIPKQVPMDGIQLEKLKLKLGPELRFQVPFMINLALSGGVEFSGAPQDLKPEGEIYIDGGMVNLFATQLTVSREDSPGTVRFVSEQGFDPDLDLTFTSPGDEFKAICKGRAGSWQENLILRFRGAEGTDEENLSQAARLFQTKLADALVAENGQLALVNLAASTMATMSPRLDTWGQIGGARWRLITGPNISYLLANTDELNVQDIVTGLFSGTEIEVQYGPTQAVIAHKAHGTASGMQWNLGLNLTDNVKVSAGVANTPSPTASVLVQYSSEARTRMKK